MVLATTGATSSIAALIPCLGRKFRAAHAGCRTAHPRPPTQLRILDVASKERGSGYPDSDQLKAHLPGCGCSGCFCSGGWLGCCSGGGVLGRGSELLGCCGGAARRSGGLSCGRWFGFGSGALSWSCGLFDGGCAGLSCGFFGGFSRGGGLLGCRCGGIFSWGCGLSAGRLFSGGLEAFGFGRSRLFGWASGRGCAFGRLAFGAGALRFVFVSGGCSLRYAGGRFSGRAFPAAGLAFADERAGTTPGPRKTPGFGVAATGGFPWFAEAWNSRLFLAVCCCCICIGVACRCASRATAISAEVGRAVLPPFPPL